MNQEYVYIDGKVIVKTDKEIKKPISYYDNLNEVLIQENVIETIKECISTLEQESENYKKTNKKYHISFIIPATLLMTTILSPILFSILVSTNGAISCSLFLSAVFLPLATIAELQSYRYHKNLLKTEKGINSQLDFLKNQIIVESEKLNNLKKEKKLDKENNDFKVVEVSDLEKLKKLKEWLNIYFDLGYNCDEYYKYWQNGTLDVKLSENYDDEEIEVAKKYLKEKGPTLTKK